MKNYGWVVVATGALMTCVAFGAVAIALAFPPFKTSKELVHAR